MLSSQEGQAERRRVFAQDQSVPNQASTFHQHATADANIPRGRFSAVETATIVGSQPTINYPPAAAHQRDPCGPEPSLGYRIDDLNPSDLEVAYAIHIHLIELWSNLAMVMCETLKLLAISTSALIRGKGGLSSDVRDDRAKSLDFRL